MQNLLKTKLKKPVFYSRAPVIVFVSLLLLSFTFTFPPNIKEALGESMAD